jgi:hypothetical protein
MDYKRVIESIDRSVPPFSETKGSKTILEEKGVRAMTFCLPLKSGSTQQQAGGTWSATLGPRAIFLYLAWSWRGISVVGKRHPVNRRSSSARIWTAAKGGVKSQYQSSRIGSSFVGNAPLARRRNRQVTDGTERDRISFFCESYTTKYWFRNATQCNALFRRLDTPQHYPALVQVGKGST